jgi:anti-sigma B factor antagonist
MKLRESKEGHVDVFHLEDEIDLHYAPALRALFQAKSNQRCPALVVNLSGVPFIDSTGIAALLEYRRDAADFGGNFCVAAPTDHVRHVFEIVRLHEALPIFESTAAAIAAMASDTMPLPVHQCFGSEPQPVSRAA